VLPGKIADSRRDGALPVVCVMQIDQRRASAGMAHAS
jgi:hypothetical protein